MPGDDQGAGRVKAGHVGDGVTPHLPAQLLQQGLVLLRAQRPVVHHRSRRRHIIVSFLFDLGRGEEDCGHRGVGDVGVAEGELLSTRAGRGLSETDVTVYGYLAISTC